MSDSKPVPIKELRGATVVAGGQSYTNARVELHDGWTHIYTDREQPNTEPEVWVPNERVKEVQPR